MRNRTCAALVLVVLLAGSAPAFLKSYEVVPTQAAWSAWTRRDEPANWVGQTFVCNFDSLAEVALFTGFPGAGGNYDLQVRDLETDDLIAHQYGAGQAGDHRWMRFTAIVPDGKLTRGKEYLVKFTRPGDSIHYYTDIGSRYPYGHLVVGGQFHNGLDLCTRLYGKAYVDGIFSTQSNIPGKDQVIGNDTVPFDKENWHACVEREAEVGVRSDKLGYGYWGWVQRHGPDEWNWGWLDTLMSHYVANGVQPTMSFRGPTGWTTCAVAKVPERPLVWQPNGGAIPKNLYHPVAIPSGGDRVINPDNYYAKYIYEFVRRYGPIGYTFNEQEAGTYWRAHPGTYQPVTLFEGQPEVPWQALAHIDSTPDHPGGYWRLDATRWYQPRGDTGWWLAESLTDQTYRDTISAHIAAHNGDTVAGRKSSLASVYARLVIVVDSAVKLACAQVTQGEEMPRTAAYIFDHGAYGMQNWLQRLKSFGADEHFDVATYFSFHDWRDGNGPEGHRATFRWLRDEMEQAGYAPRNLWATEFGTSCPPW
ncbi:hypothetical protein FJY71_05090, partial [candidate division WOR-3 bacterium]|nr:hypothetical protein [candidate division WOR-3 bacterium]